MTTDEKDLRIAELEALVAELTAQVAVLTERLNKNSGNSSKPPSSDPPWKDPNKKRAKSKRKRRKRGAQKGHKGSSRPLVPEEEVNEIINVKPTQCKKCNSTLRGSDPWPQKHQVFDIPKTPLHVSEHRLHKLKCRCCGASTRAELPKGVPKGAFGPRLVATIALLTSRFKVSKRGAKEFVEEVFGIKMALGSISSQEQRLSKALASPVAEAASWIQRQEVANLDETSWRQQAVLYWLWVMATFQVAVFTIRKNRSRAVLMSILGPAWNGIAISDRFSAYAYLLLRQLCWAHLCRDFVAMSERGGESQIIGERFLALATTLFQEWHSFRRGEFEREELKTRTRPLGPKFLEIVSDGSVCDSIKTANTCVEIGKVAHHAFTFIEVENVEPTNNHGERQIRPAAIWRRVSFGTQSPAGTLFVERVLTCNGTLNLQRRSIFKFYDAVLEADLRGTLKPSLLPSS